MSKAAPRIGAYYAAVKASGSQKRLADAEAVRFYCLNHLAAVARSRHDPDDPLPPWAAEVMGEYVRCLVDQAPRVYTYLVMIVTREARHTGGHANQDAIMEHLGALEDAEGKKLYPANLLTYLRNLPKDEEESAELICSKWPNATLGQYVGALVGVFEHSSWGSGGGYGGKAWATVARCLEDVVRGRTSLEAMVDTAYALAHNNGPIFNKEMLYEGYTEHFIKLLDLQRAGQLPEAVLSGALDHAKLSETGVLAALRTMVERVAGAVPGAFGAAVDWELVMARGAVGNYAAEVKKAKKKAAPPPPPPAPPKFAGKPAQVVGQVWVHPHASVTKYERAAP